MKTEFGFHVELHAKSLNDETGEISGYASMFNEQDSCRDIVLPGAFKQSLQDRPASRVKMLRGHDTNDPIGTWSEIVEDSQGLKVKGKLLLTTIKGKETYELVKIRAMDGLSIGFRTLKDRIDRGKGVRFLEALDLAEISIVTFPMLASATIQTVKTGDPDAARALVTAIQNLTERLKR